MEVYRSQEELERILSRLWERIFADPQITKAVADAKLVAKFRYTDFPSVLSRPARDGEEIEPWSLKQNCRFGFRHIRKYHTSDKLPV